MGRKGAGAGAGAGADYEHAHDHVQEQEQNQDQNQDHDHKHDHRLHGSSTKPDRHADGVGNGHGVHTMIMTSVASLVLTSLVCLSGLVWSSMVSPGQYVSLVSVSGSVSLGLFISVS